jgi:cobalt-zinc-cadmium efflux system outer membrane protein
MQRLDSERSFMTTVIFLAVLSGCTGVPTTVDQSPVTSDLVCRTGFQAHRPQCTQAPEIPPGVELGDGLSEAEAIACALWNNAPFHATLSRLGMARGDLVQAGLLTNPQLQLLLPGGSKQFEWTMYVGLEALILRRHRVEISERELCRTAQDLVQLGLNLVRDTRLAYADWVFAIERSGLAVQSREIRDRIAGMSAKRLEAGDISQFEVSVAEIDALRVTAEAAGLELEPAAASERLKNLMGLSNWDLEFVPVPIAAPLRPSLDEDSLVAEGLATRPDVVAAWFAVDVARKRSELTKWSWLRFDLVADGNAAGNGPTNAGPGFRFDIPIFNRNEGLVMRAEWTADEAVHNYIATRDRATAEIRTAAIRLRQADATLTVLNADVLKRLSGAVELAERSYQDGAVPYFLVLQSTSQFIDAQIRQVELHANLRRALAELERSVGRRIVDVRRTAPDEPDDVREVSPTRATLRDTPDEGSDDDIAARGDAQ